MSESDLLRTVSAAIRTCSEAARDADIEPGSVLTELPLDSLDLVAVMMTLQDEHKVELDLDAVPDFKVVADIMAELGRQLRARAA